MCQLYFPFLDSKSLSRAIISRLKIFISASGKTEISLKELLYLLPSFPLEILSLRLSYREIFGLTSWAKFYSKFGEELEDVIFDSAVNLSVAATCVIVTRWVHLIILFAFSTPVRGSVDAGQPGSADTRSSIRNLVAAQEKQNARGYQIDYVAGGKVNSIQANALEKGTSDHRRSQKRPSVNVTTNPLDISLISGTQPCNTQGCNIQSNASTKSRGRSTGESLESFFLFPAR